MTNLPIVISFKNARTHDQSVIGERGVKLAQLSSLKLNVLPGFIVSASAFIQLLSSETLDEIKSTIKECNLQEPDSFIAAAKRIHSLLHHVEYPVEFVQQIIHAYDALGAHESVRIFPSNRAKKLPYQLLDDSDLKGDANVLEEVRKIWTSSFSASTLRALIGIAKSDFFLAVPSLVIQKSVQPEVTGYSYTKHPYKYAKNQIYLEATYTSDHHKNPMERYVVEVPSYTILETEHPAQTDIAKTTGTPSVLKTEEVRKLAKVTRSIHQGLFFHQRVEWVMSDHQFFIIDTEPLVEAVKTDPQTLPQEVTGMSVLLQGESVFSGLISGKARICLDAQACAAFQPGEILVVPKVNMLELKYVQNAVAVISDEPIDQRDVKALGVPTIGATHHATRILHNGQEITVHGQTGRIYAGGLHYAQTTSNSTQVYLDLSGKLPAKIPTDINGICPLSAEDLIKQFGHHPKALLKSNLLHQFGNQMEAILTRYATQAQPNPVYYKLSNLNSFELRELEHGKEHSPSEHNPFLGFRGVQRLLADPDFMLNELTIIAQLRAQGLRNLHIMLPFVRSVDELMLLRKLLKDHKLWDPQVSYVVEIETPTAALGINQFIRQGITEFYLSYRSLISLATGTDMRQLTNAYQSPHNTLVLETILKEAINKATSAHAKVIVGDCEYDRTLLEWLVRNKVTGISCSAKQLEFVKSVVL